MPLISVKPEVKLERIRFKIPGDLLQEIKNYCEAFEIKTLENFFLKLHNMF